MKLVIQNPLSNYIFTYQKKKTEILWHNKFTQGMNDENIDFVLYKPEMDESAKKSHRHRPVDKVPHRHRPACSALKPSPPRPAPSKICFQKLFLDKFFIKLS